MKHYYLLLLLSFFPFLYSMDSDDELEIISYIETPTTYESFETVLGNFEIFDELIADEEERVMDIDPGLPIINGRTLRGDAQLVNGKYQCDICGTLYERLLSCYMHRMRTHEPKRFACQRKGCDAKCYFQSDLKEHERQMHLANTYFDKEMVIGPTEKIIGHSKAGRILKQHICPFSGCGRTFDKRTKAQKHIAVNHLTSEVFSCLSCGAHYSTQDGLSCHMIKKHRKQY